MDKKPRSSIFVHFHDSPVEVTGVHVRQRCDGSVYAVFTFGEVDFYVEKASAKELAHVGLVLYKLAGDLAMGMVES